MHPINVVIQFFGSCEWQLREPLSPLCRSESWEEQTWVALVVVSSKTELQSLRSCAYLQLCWDVQNQLPSSLWRWCLTTKHHKTKQVTKTAVIEAKLDLRASVSRSFSLKNIWIKTFPDFWTEVETWCSSSFWREMVLLALKGRHQGVTEKTP